MDKKYLEVGVRVAYEAKHYNYKTKTRETIRQTGVILSMQSRGSIGYTSTKVRIKPDITGPVVVKIVGTPYADKVWVLEDQQE